MRATLEHLYFQQQSGDDWNTTETLMHSEADIEIFGDSRGSHHYNPRAIEERLVSPIHELSFERTSEALELKALEGLDFEWWDYLQDPRFYGHTEKFFDRAHLKGEAAEEFSRIIADRVKPFLTRPTLAQVSRPR